MRAPLLTRTQFEINSPPTLRPVSGQRTSLNCWLSVQSVRRKGEDAVTGDLWFSQRSFCSPEHLHADLS